MSAEENTVKTKVDAIKLPTVIEVVEEQIDERIDMTLSDLDERLFYICDKYSSMSSEEFAAVVERQLKDFTARVLENIQDWD